MLFSAFDQIPSLELECLANYLTCTTHGVVIETPKIEVTYEELSVEGKGDVYVGHRALP
nr:hypothetical protein [Tanacetum cinerariifolium]